MTKKEKQLLLQDLCARLPYGVKCNAILKQIDGSLKSVFGTFKGYNGWATVGNNLVDIETVKPYLRPMSSMTEEEMCDLVKLLHAVDEPSCVPELISLFVNSIDGYDWLNKHGFDYRGLIPMGLALEATKDMYK